MDKFQVFIIRAILGAAFAVLLGRMFFEDMNIIKVAGFGVFLVAASYVAEYLRHRKSDPK